MIKKYKQFTNKKVNESEVIGSEFYQDKLEELAIALDTNVVDNKIEYDGKEIIFPSETAMYHVDGKKFKESQEVVEYLNSQK